MAGVDQASTQKTSSARGFLVLSRLPFLSPGIAALVTGMLLAILADFEPDLVLLAMSLIGLSLIMLATYYFNEYFDYEGDVINKSYIMFSGGSRAIPDRMVPRTLARLAGYGSVAILAAIAVIYMLFYFTDYPALLPLALFGAFCGVFYSHPPFQWAYKGIGEVLIGGCYGILAMVSGYYVVSGALEIDLLLVAMPASITIFCVIVANEFPDIEADRAVNKRNLVVRLGLRTSSWMFSVLMLLTYPVMVSTLIVGVNWTIVLFGIPVLLLTVFAALITLRGGYENGPQQVKISGATLLANLLSSLVFVLPALGW